MIFELKLEWVEPNCKRNQVLSRISSVDCSSAAVCNLSCEECNFHILFAVMSSRQQRRLAFYSSVSNSVEEKMKKRWNQLKNEKLRNKDSWGWWRVSEEKKAELKSCSNDAWLWRNWYWVICDSSAEWFDPSLLDQLAVLNNCEILTDCEVKCCAECDSDQYTVKAHWQWDWWEDSEIPRLLEYIH